MKIKDLPWFNRPGFKLTRNGVKTLDNAELLAIIFGIGANGESALELSNRLLKDYNLNKLDDLSFNELKEECNDIVKALQLSSLIELSKRYNKLINGGYDNKIKHKKINSAKDVKNIFIDKFRNYKKEVLSIILLDTKNKIISFKEGITIGILNSSLIHPREIFKEAIKESANSVILVHNHPSGDPNPSQKDIEITKKIFEAGELLGINVLDHIIIGNEGYWSYKENQSNNAP